MSLFVYLDLAPPQEECVSCSALQECTVMYLEHPDYALPREHSNTIYLLR